MVAVEGVDDLYNIPFASNPGDEKGGHIAVEAGKQVTVRLTPDYGYQLTGVTLNGGVTLAPQAEVSTFTFTILRLLKMEQMRLQVEICVLPWRIRMQIQQMHLHR